MIFVVYYLNAIHENTHYLSKVSRFFNISKLYLLRAYIVTNYYFCINDVPIVIEHCGVFAEEY